MTDTGTDSPTTATPAPPAATAERASPPPHPGRTLALTSAATAVALMTYTAPLVTLPETAADLHTSLSAQAWLLNGTPLGLAALLLVAGSLADDYGRRRLFVSGTLALGVTTVLGAFATTTLLFTLARIAPVARSRPAGVGKACTSRPRLLASSAALAAPCAIRASVNSKVVDAKAPRTVVTPRASVPETNSRRRP